MNEFEDNIIMKQINYLNAFLDELCQQDIGYEIADRHKVILAPIPDYRKNIWQNKSVKVKSEFIKAPWT